MALVQFRCEYAYLTRFQEPLHLASAAVNVKRDGSSHASLRLNLMDYTFLCGFIVENAETRCIHSWIRIPRFSERALYVDALFFQVIFDDFLPLSSYWRLCVLATADFTFATYVERACFA
jgi:hypothetical protein